MKYWTRLRWLRNSKRIVSAALAAAAISAAFLYIRARACGPDWAPDVFIPEHHPSSPKLYGDGRLGILQPGYFHTELVVAYRYLSGGKLSDAEKAIYLPKPEPPTDTKAWEAKFQAEEDAKPVNVWTRARAGYTRDATPPAPSSDRTVQRKFGNYVYQEFELNCTDGAFTTAVETMQARAKAWGAESDLFREWLRGQDAVFANCAKPAEMPASAQPEWPVLLKQDRAYQIAAAEFYAQDFDGAIQGFEAIQRDTASPWSRWGGYLAARALVRKAAAAKPGQDDGSPAVFDLNELQQAYDRLIQVEQRTHDMRVSNAAVAELHFVDVRLHPTRRLDGISAVLSGPYPDRDFAQDLIDFDFLLERGVTGNSDLTRWVAAMQGGASPAAPDTVIETWRAKHTKPWLVAALARLQPGDPGEQEFMRAAADLTADSSAYETANYHRARLLLAEGRLADARALLDIVLVRTRSEEMASTRNTFLEQRIQTSRTLQEFLADAPRSTVAQQSQSAFLAKCSSWGKKEHCEEQLPEQQFDGDAAKAFNMQLPLADWSTAATSAALPSHLRSGVAWAGWLRALGLGDAATARRLAPMLPAKVKTTASDSTGFPATLAVLRNPGMRPYLEHGVQRSVTYSALDEFRDNWWCEKWGDGVAPQSTDSPVAMVASQPKPLPFLTSAERQAADAERARLNALPNATIWLGQRTLEYVKAHPEDKDAAEALALVVRATHYSCSGQEDKPDQHAVSKQAFELLHRRYPTSEWARKTKYYY